MVCTISSDGKIRLYDLAALPISSQEKTQLQPVAEYDTKGTRLTCLALADGDLLAGPSTNGKRKREVDADEEDEAEADEDEFGSENEASEDAVEDEDEAEEEDEDEFEEE